ncbi:MAG: Hsp20/alpha crystallin family protein [Pseudomonadota bacterium]|nr:Hsp20/alpha crystallin family protein [Pseudomonadota bacterium]
MLVPNNFFEKSFFDNWFDHWHGDEVTRFMPKAGIAEQEKEFVLNLDLPGFKKDELDVEVKGDQLVVKGERRKSELHKEGGYIREERSFGNFERRFVLPQSVERNKIAVSYVDGVLQVTMPKCEEAAARRLKISS